jgi:Leucine Rich repeat
MNDPFARRQPGRLARAELHWIARGPSWRAPRLADLNRPAPIDYEQLMRGNRIAGRAFIAHGAELARRGKLKAIQLVAVAPFLAELANCPHLAAVESLDLAGNRIGPVGLSILLGSPYLSNATRLDLRANDLGDAGAFLLASTTNLPSLRSLILGDNGIGPAGERALWSGPGRTGLMELDLGAISVGTVRPAA